MYSYENNNNVSASSSTPRHYHAPLLLMTPVWYPQVWPPGGAHTGSPQPRRERQRGGSRPAHVPTQPVWTVPLRERTNRPANGGHLVWPVAGSQHSVDAKNN